MQHSSESVGRTKKAKANSSSHDVRLDKAQRQLRASLTQTRRAEVQKELEEKVATKERATSAARSRDHSPEKRIRPPLAADGTRPPVAMPAPAPVPVPTTSAEPQVPKPSKGKKSQAAASLGPSTIADTQATSLSQQTMLGHPSHRGVGGGGEEREKKENAKRAPAAPSNKAVKLAAPRTAAVTVTITPETTERGRTYESVLKRARAYADPIQLGIGAITCRRTQTGARIFQFPGPSSAQNANFRRRSKRRRTRQVCDVGGHRSRRLRFHKRSSCGHCSSRRLHRRGGAWSAHQDWPSRLGHNPCRLPSHRSQDRPKSNQRTAADRVPLSCGPST
ncbi:hypothetical protein SFRURICE_006448 [Spodoptera frugiperda]|nr:hypothetical protein SFRURICE_006448 [Spodoptera frugiperda]